MLYTNEYLETQDKPNKSTSWDAETEKAYTELSKLISCKYQLKLGKIKLGLKKYGLNGIFDKPDEFGLTEGQRDEIELIYILATKDLSDFENGTVN